MKKIKLFSVAFLLIGSGFLMSCSSGRGYYSQPRYRNSYSLIISPTPGFVMNRYPDGRYYYRSPEGMMYWRGYDNRFYLDRSYIGRVQYNRGEYNEWKYQGKRYSRRYR